MILCCPPWRSVQGSAFRALLCSLVLLTMLVLCACACVLLCLCACSLVLLTMLLLRACACGWGGGEGTSPSRLITANERTPWRSILASRNLQYALSCCTLYTHSYNLQYHVVHCTASCSFARTGLVQVLEVLPSCLPRHSSPLLEQCSHCEEGQQCYVSTCLRGWSQRA